MTTIEQKQHENKSQNFLKTKENKGLDSTPIIIKKTKTTTTFKIGRFIVTTPNQDKAFLSEDEDDSSSKNSKIISID